MVVYIGIYTTTYQWTSTLCSLYTYTTTIPDLPPLCGSLYTYTWYTTPIPDLPPLCGSLYTYTILLGIPDYHNLEVVWYTYMVYYYNTRFTSGIVVVYIPILLLYQIYLHFVVVYIPIPYYYHQIYLHFVVVYIPILYYYNTRFTSTLW